MAKEETLKKKPGRRVIEENLTQFHFTEETPNFSGRFIEKLTITPENSDPFDLFKFATLEGGEMVTLPSNFTIARAIDKVKDMGENFDNIIFHITFLGKTMVKNKPFSKFKIEIEDEIPAGE